MSPEQLPDPLTVAAEFAAVLERLDIPYVIGGSIASSLHGAPRSTLDVDIVAALGLRHVDPLVAALMNSYYVDADTVRQSIRNGESFNAINLASAVKVDVFPAGDDAFDAERLARRQRVEIWPDPVTRLFVDRAEYTVVRKLEWFRRGGEVSKRQWSDVLGILRTQGPRLDRVLMESWSDRLGVADLLSRAFDAVGA